MNKKLFAIVTIVLFALVLICAIIACAIPYWSHVSISVIEISLGLFKSCSTVSGTTTCVDITDAMLTSRFQAVRAMAILTVLFSCAVLVIAIVVGFVKPHKILFWVGLIIAIFTVIWPMIAFAIWADGQTSDSLHAGFGLEVCAFVLALIGCVTYFLMKPGAGSSQVM